MGRYYRLSKKITDDMATAILNEINELENVHDLKASLFDLCRKDIFYLYFCMCRVIIFLYIQRFLPFSS